MDARSGAFVVHLTPRRIRIKIPRWRRHPDNFAVLQRALESRPEVVCVRVNPLAASIVIHCGDGFEIASVRDCFAGLEFFLAPCGLSGRACQIALAQRVRHDPQSARFAGFILGLVIAIATRRFAAVFRELILEAAARAFVRQLHRQLIGSTRLAAPRAPLAAGAG
jgi:hypothetical protein